MPSEVRVPALPESVADATVLTWHFKPGDPVRKDDNLVDLETDKVVLEVPSPSDGVLGEVRAAEGELVTPDTVLAQIESAAPKGTEVQPTASSKRASELKHAAARNGSAATASASRDSGVSPAGERRAEAPIAPAARRLIKEMNLDPSRISGTGKAGRITKADVIAWLDTKELEGPEMDPDAAAIAAHQASLRQPAAKLVSIAPAASASSQPAPESTPTEEVMPPALSGEAGRPEQRVPMTRLRARIAERLVEAQQTAAMLTTFNEVDMHAVMTLRSQYKERFERTHGVRLGLMSFFVKAAVEALQRFPVVNASVDGNDIVYHGYYDIGVAVSSERGLVVPILRNCDRLSMADIERGIVDFAAKAKDGSLSFDELTGGTFSITNGGVFGSLLSTPILNPPQSAILGVHKVQDRAVVVDGQVSVRPMMYLALSYDHRIVDGRDAVQFLVTIKETLEDPARLLLRI